MVLHGNPGQFKKGRMDHQNEKMWDEAARVQQKRSQKGKKKKQKQSFQVPEWASRPLPAAARELRIEVTKKGAAVGTVLVGEQAHYTFGKRSANLADIKLDHGSISRRHAMIFHDGRQGEVFVVDLGSKNGTTLDGADLEPLEPQRMRCGSTLRFGSSSRTYTLRGLGTSGGARASSSTSGSGAAAGADGAATPSPSTSLSGQDELLRQQLPMSFGGSAKLKKEAQKEGLERTAPRKRLRDSIEDRTMPQPPPSPAPSSSRAERERQIAAMTASLAAPARLEDAARAKGQAEASAAAVASGGLDLSSSSSSSSNAVGPLVPGMSDADSAPMTEAERAQDAFAEAMRLPVSHEILMRAHNKAVTCVAVDRAGARMASGSIDSHVKLWDFHGMDARHRAFRDLEPDGSVPIVAASYSPSGDRLLVASGAAQARVLDRDGKDVLRFRKGDPYLVDMKKTKGHVTAVADAMWHPTDPGVCLTCSGDGSVRTWDLAGKTHFGELLNWQVIKPKDRSGRRLGAMACAYSPSGKMIAAGCEDGSLQLWAVKARASDQYHRPTKVLAGAHAASTALGAKGQNGAQQGWGGRKGGSTSGDYGISSIVFNGDGRLMASRGRDHTLKVWDIRMFKRPVKTFTGLRNDHAGTNAIFSPDSSLLLTGTSIAGPSADDEAGRGGGVGALHVFDVQSADEAPRMVLGISRHSVVRLAWHAKLNQIAVGSGNGHLRVLYSPRFSTKGAMLSAGRAPKKRETTTAAEMGLISHNSIINPNALPMYAQGPSKKKQRVMDRKDPVKSKAPFNLTKGPFNTKYVNPSHNLSKQIISDRSVAHNYLDEDARDALLKYDGWAKKHGDMVDKVYDATQPVKLMASKTLEQEIDEEREKERRNDSLKPVSA